jgi:hypothetical protein
VAHEWGHAFEAKSSGSRAAATEFLAHRTGGAAPVNFAAKFPLALYEPDEQGHDDDFGRHFGPNAAYYCGKSRTYGADPTPQAVEILSMGFEALHANPAKFAHDDPEYCTFILGILNGELR